MVLDHHQVAGGERGVDGPGRVRDHERLHPEAAEDPDREDHLLEGVALVEVDAPLHHRDRDAAGAADDERAPVAGDGGGGEVRDLREGDGHRLLEGVGEGPEAGAEDDPDRGRERRARADGGGRLVEPREEGRSAHSSIPARVALMKAARFPASIARRPRRAMSLRRSGARPPMPPIWMPMLEKFAKPRSA